MAIYSGFSHWKWWFSIVMLNYQRVFSRMPVQDTVRGPAACHHVTSPCPLAHAWSILEPQFPARNSHGLPGETTIVDVGILSPRDLTSMAHGYGWNWGSSSYSKFHAQQHTLNGSAIVRAILHSSPPSRQPNTWHMISNNQNDLKICPT